MKWLDIPIPEEPPESAKSKGSRNRAVASKLMHLVAKPGVWHRVAEGNVGSSAKRIREDPNLPGTWEAVVRDMVLYARFVGFDE